MDESKSYFDGGLLQYIGWSIYGKRLQFDGIAYQLFGN